MKDALYFNGNPTVPLYELSAESFTVPVYIEKCGKTFTLFVTLRTPDYESYRKVLSGISFYNKKEAGRDVTDTEIDLRAQARFARENFVGLVGAVNASGKPFTAETISETLADKIGRAALGYITGTTEEASSDVLVFDDEGDIEEIPTELALADPSKKSEVSVPIVHELRPASETDRMAYKKATKLRSKQEGKTEVTWGVVNHNSLNKLYDSMILSLKGAVIEKVPCSETNKDKWLPLIPLRWKTFVLNEVFSKADSKNA